MGETVSKIDASVPTIQSWDDYKSVAKLHVTSNHYQHLSNHEIIFTDDDYNRLTRGITNGFNRDLRRPSDVKAFTIIADERLKKWEINNRKPNENSLDQIITPSEVASELIYGVLSLKNLILLRDPKNVITMEKTYKLRLTGCLEALQINWALTHFSRAHSSEHYTDEYMLLKAIYYKDSYSIVRYTKTVKWSKAHIEASYFSKMHHENVGNIKFDDISAFQLFTIGAKNDDIDLFNGMSDLHMAQSVGYSQYLELIEVAITNSSLNSLRYLLPIVSDDNILTAGNSNDNTQQSDLTVPPSRLQNILIYTLISQMQLNINDVTYNQKLTFEEKNQVLVFGSPQRSPGVCIHICEYILSRSDITYGNLVDLFDVIVLIFNRFKCFDYFVADEIIRTIINHPIFISGMLDDNEQKILNGGKYSFAPLHNRRFKHKDCLFRLCDDPYAFLNITTLRYLFDKSDMVYVKYILNNMIVNVPSSQLGYEIIYHIGKYRHYKRYNRGLLNTMMIYLKHYWVCPNYKLLILNELWSVYPKSMNGHH